MSIHTELPHDDYGLWDSKGGAETWRVKKMLTRVAAMIIFLSLTKENVSILILRECSDVPR